MKLLEIKKYLTSQIIDFIGGQKVMSLQIDITNACNLKCGHCYHAHHNNKGAISFNDWCGILEQYRILIEKYHLVPRIVICGGEPTISPLLLPIIRHIDSLWSGVKVSILTNGTRLTDKLLEQLTPFNVEFQISLDGPDSFRHDDIRGAGNFEKAADAVRRARAIGFNVFLLAILSKKTSHWIEDFFVMAKELRANQMNFTRFVSQGSGAVLEASGQDRALRPFELKEAMTTIWKTSKETGIRTDTYQALYTLIDPSLGANDKYGFQGLIVDYKGNLKISSRADAIVGNVINDGLENLFISNSVLMSLRHGKVRKCGPCAHYRRCGGSRNASYAATGSFLEADPGCWLDMKNETYK